MQEALDVEASMTKMFDLVPGWIYAAAIALLLFFMLGQRVQVSNAKAAQARSAKDLADYKLSVSEATRILQAANDRKAAENTARQLEATNAARTRETILRNDAAGARSELERLRGAIRLAARRDPVPGTSASADDQHASTEGKLLAQCAAEYQQLGEAADGHASDVQTLIESWPR
jgi:hypothetical protein